MANAGAYVVTGTAYQEIADMDQFDLGFDVLPSYVGRMRGFIWEGYHRDIGSPESLVQAETDIRAGALHTGMSECEQEKRTL
jgi:NDP-sugar pyrophosphorylase family protein